ncbi:MAG: DUF2059 domain-containing protein [Bacillota bacterium]
MLKLSSAAAAALLVISSAAAAQPAVRGAPDPARVSAAEAYLDAMHYDRQMNRAVDAIVAEMDRSFDAQFGGDAPAHLPQDLLTKIKAIADTHMRSAFAEHRAELKRGTALIYASHFTVAELQHLAQLQSDPIVVRMQEEMPQIAADTMALTQGLAEQEGDKVRDEVKTAVEDYLAHKSSNPTS